MPSLNYVVTCIDPRGIELSKSFSLKKYTKEQAEYLGEEWKKVVRSGKAKEWVTMSFTKYLEGGGSGVVRSVKDLFEFKEDFDLDLPFTNGGVSFAIIGSTRSGKSTAMCYLYEKYFKKHLTILQTLSSQADIYDCMKKKALVCGGYKPELIKDMMKINKGTKNKYPFCLVFDDLAMDGKNDKMMTTLLCVGRNQGISCLIMGQRLQMLNATGRANCNYILCFKQNTDSAVEDTIKTYLRSYFPKTYSVDEMCRAYRELTADHQFFCIDTLNDKCFLSKIKL